MSASVSTTRLCPSASGTAPARVLFLCGRFHHDPGPAPHPATRRSGPLDLRAQQTEFEEDSESPLAQEQRLDLSHTSALLKAQAIQRHLADPDIDAEEELEAVSDDAIALGLEAQALAGAGLPY